MSALFSCRPMNPTDAPTAASDAASEVPRIRALLREQKFSEALAACDTLLSQVPDHRDLLLFRAICQRYLSRVSDALATLQTLERHHRRFSRLYEERGHCFVVLKQAAP